MIKIKSNYPTRPDGLVTPILKEFKKYLSAVLIYLANVVSLKVDLQVF